MTTIETYRKRAKLLMRWRRERNHSVGGKVRLLPCFHHLSDIEALEQPMPLAVAQEIVAVEAGYADWSELKQALETAPAARPAPPPSSPRLLNATPILFVRDVAAAARFYGERLGFDIDFLHGRPPFYGSVSRDGACLHLRLVGAPNFADLAQRETSLILATVAVSNVKALFAEIEGRGAAFAQRLVQQAWGGLDFQIRDPDGNVISFVQYRTAEPDAPDAKDAGAP